VNSDQQQTVRPVRSRALGGLGLFLLIGIWLGIIATRDYKWAAGRTRDMTSQGWSPAATSNNSVSVTHPWTIVHAPVTLIWFMKPEEAVAVSSGVYLIPQLRVRYDYDDTETEELLALYDLDKSRHTALAPESRLEEIDLSSLTWYTPQPGTPGEDLMQFVVREVAQPKR